MTDPISDLLTRVRNGYSAELPTVTMPHSQIKTSIAAVLKQEGYITDYSVDGDKKKTLTLKLKYHGRKGVVEGLQRISSPGLRRYVGADEIPRVLGGLGTSIMSTSRGVMSGVQARRQNIGGEVLCYVW